jgi:K+-transporting ATPase c subunit
VTGVIYPLAVTGIGIGVGQLAFHDQAGGSLVGIDGRDVGLGGPSGR